ncbi:hypothetical protein BU23DRAFT_653374, partial [Bimuria novae-zelandiae CBS 107.79]
STKLLYISSISSVAQLPSISHSSNIPEEVVKDFNAPYDIGYAKSKLVSELLCDTASRKLGLPISFVRVGQIAGTVEGETIAAWNTAEWLSNLVITSISLGALPDDLGAELHKVDWIPVDMLAKTLGEQGTNLSRPESASGASSSAQTFNLLNPKPTSWKALLPDIISSIKNHTGKILGIVSAAAWLEMFQEVGGSFSAHDATDLLQTHPAIKLQESYEARMAGGQKAIEWEMESALAKSTTLNGMLAVGGEWMDK